MWKKPILQKPEFTKVNLDEISEKESLETNGGAISLLPNDMKNIIRLSGMIAIPYDLTGIKNPAESTFIPKNL